MKKVLISGASGFVGKNLIPHLKANDIQVETLQLRDDFWEEKLVDCDVVIHLAGKAHDLKKNVDTEEYYQVNFELTRKLYDAFLQSDIRKFIFVSSVKASKDNVNGVLTEESIPDPQTHYGRSKLKAEDYIMAQPLPENKYYYILRPCMIHGPGNKGNLNLLYKFVRMGIPYPLAAFENRRSFLSIQNLCFIIQKLLEREITCGIYNVADDEALSTNEVVSILARSLNRKPKLLMISSKLIRFIARIGDHVKLPLNTERLNKLTENYVVCNRKIKEGLGVRLPLSSKVGLEITASSFRD